MNRSLLRPAVALAGRTFVMWGGRFVARIPALQRAGMKLDATIPRGEQLATLPAEVRWKAANDQHLFEQPTIFHPVVSLASLLPVNGSGDLRLAWSCVGLRVVHGVHQAAIHRIEVLLSRSWPRRRSCSRSRCGPGRPCFEPEGSPP